MTAPDMSGCMQILNWMGEHPVLTFFLAYMACYTLAYILRGNK